MVKLSRLKNLNQTGFLTDSLLATFNLMLQERGISLLYSGFLLRKPENYNQVITFTRRLDDPPRSCLSRLEAKEVLLSTF